jgi:hypothetical protein
LAHIQPIGIERTAASVLLQRRREMVLLLACRRERVLTLAIIVVTMLMCYVLQDLEDI